MKKFFLLGLLSFFIYADVMYEMETTTKGMAGMADGITITRNFIKGEWMRTEIKSENNLLGSIEKIIITRLDKGVIWLLDKEKKEYIEMPINLDAIRTFSDSFKTLPEIKIEKMDETKTILKIECKKYQISAEINSPEGSFNLRHTLWVGKNFPGYNDIMAFNNKMQGSIGDIDIPGIDNKVLKEVKKKVSEIDGFPMEMELIINMGEEGMEIRSTSTITKISTVPISDRVFDIPEGYNLVSTQTND
jgi:hypothetical protein